MAATDLDDLNNFETHIESAAVTFLNTATGISVVRTVVEDSLVTPRIEVQLQMDDANEPFAPRNGGADSSAQDYRSYGANFLANLVTDNATGGASAHAGYRSEIRTQLMRTATNWDSSTLPYYDMKLIRPLGAEYETDGDMNVTQLSWQIIFEIRDDAWPA